jgi:hypothetical protein
MFAFRFTTTCSARAIVPSIGAVLVSPVASPAQEEEPPAAVIDTLDLP